MRNNVNGMHAGAKPELFRFAEKLRRHMTEAELVLWEFFRTKTLGYKFRRQHPFDKYILDFYCHQLKLSIEIDGKYHHTIEQKLLDIQRTKDIIRLGLTEIRFTNDEVLNDYNQTLKIISKTISQLELKNAKPSLEKNICIRNKGRTQ